MKKSCKVLGVFLAVIMLISAFSAVSFAADCEHSYDATVIAPTCVESGYTFYACSLCGDSYKEYNSSAPATGHSYGDWKVLQAVSCIDEGFEQRDCSKCGSSEVKTTPVVAHVDKNYDGACDVCSAQMSTSNKVSPYDWLVAFFNAMIQWFRDIFA